MLLAQGPGQPEGDLDDRWEINLSLAPNSQLDAFAHQSDVIPWTAVRERPGHAPRESELIPLDDAWVLQSTRGDDDPLWRFDGNVIRPGELVSLGRPDGEVLLYRIVAVDGD